MAIDSFPNIPGVNHIANDGNLRIERAAPGQKITVLGVTTADIPINEPISLRSASADRTKVMHPAFGTHQAVPSELNRAMAEAGKGARIEFVKIAHGWGEEGYAFVNETGFNGHIITPAERYLALAETFDLLLNNTMDMVYVCGIYANKPADISELLESDNTTPIYSSTLGDFAYQLADFCEVSSAENKMCLSAIGRMPIRIQQFYDELDEDYFSLLHLTPLEITSIDPMTKEVVFGGATPEVFPSSSSGSTSSSSGAPAIPAWGDDVPIVGSSLVIHYPTGSRTYTVVSDDGVDTVTLLETPIELSTGTLHGLLQTFDTSGGDVYDATLRGRIQNAYRRAFRGYHPTDLTSTNEVTLHEYVTFLKGAADFTDMESLDGTSAGSGEEYPTNYRMWRAEGGAQANPAGSDIDLLDNNGHPIDMGKWLSLGTLHGKSGNSFGDQMLRAIGFSNERLYTSNGMGEYLALIFSLDEKSSTTNKSLVGFIPERATKRSTLNDLIGKRYIITTKDVNSANVIGAGNTAAYLIDQHRRSDYSLLTSVRILAKTVEGVRLKTLPYIGEAMNAVSFKALRTDIDSMYQQLVRDGYIEDNYQFDLTQSPDQRVLGHITHAQSIQPAYEFRRMYSETNLKK